MEDLQSILEKINRDGVEKAEAEAAKIIADATAKANQIVAEAQAKAEQAKAAAEKAAADYQARAAETISQSARNLVLGVREALKALLDKLLLSDVSKALSNEASTVSLVAETIRSLVGPGEIVCAPQLAKALAAQLAELGSFSVVPDATAGVGFSIRIDGGRVVHSFTPEAIAAAISLRLRPELAKLVK